MCLNGPKLIKFIAYQQCSSIRQSVGTQHSIEDNLELCTLQGQAKGQQKYKTHNSIHLNFQLSQLSCEWIFVLSQLSASAF